MGAYMCIARNGVPPAVSKTVQLNVNCKKRPRRIRWREKPFLALKGYRSFMHAQPSQHRQTQLQSGYFFFWPTWFWNLNYKASFCPLFLFLLGHSQTWELLLIWFWIPVQPQISAPIQLIGARRRSEQSLTCVAEASPKPINYWTFGTGEMIVANEKFITEVRKVHFGSDNWIYVCLCPSRTLCILAFYTSPLELKNERELETRSHAL